MFSRATILNPGDVLYIPRGWSHVAEAEGSSPSLHMTITLHVQDFTWESLLRFFVLTGDALSTVEDAGFELGHSGAVDVHSGGGSPAASYADPALKKALRAPSGCQTRSTVVGVPSKSASHEMVLVVALHTAAVASPSLREVHAPGWSNNGAETSTTVLDMVGLWEKLLIPTGLEATLDCADVSDTLDETKEVRHEAVCRQVISPACHRTLSIGSYPLHLLEHAHYFDSHVSVWMWMSTGLLVVYPSIRSSYCEQQWPALIWGSSKAG